MNLMDYAKRELALVNVKKDPMQDAMDSHILGMIELFSKEGHSGSSASYAINILNRLLRFKPLKPLTGEDDEWTEVFKGQYQNKRLSSVFKEGKDGKAYWMDGKVFSDDGGKTWFTGKNSRVYIDFPFDVPDKPEYVILPMEENKNAPN